MALIRALLICGGGIFVVFGFLHALYTFLDIRNPRRLVPDDPAIAAAMATSKLRLTRGGTTMWKAWVGFNFSHSLGLILFGSLCIAAGASLQALPVPSWVLLLFAVIGAAYSVLAVLYWFRIPIAGSAIATACFVLAWVLWLVWAPDLLSETQAWKLFVRASGTWTYSRGVAISSQGVLVTHEGESEQMPRCAQLSHADVEYLGDRIAKIKPSIAQREQRWQSIVVDYDLADITIRWPSTGDFVRLQLPLAHEFARGSPPLFVTELLDRSWQLRDAAASPCHARP